MMDFDITKDLILDVEYDLMTILLKDNTSGKNILWATDNYLEYGKDYFYDQQIRIEQIINGKKDLVRPRTYKSKTEVSIRIKDKAEVFTPSWICNNQNNLIDTAWFGKENIFNVSKGNSWKTVKRKIKFPEGKNWKDYVLSKRLEIACGEAPYLVSRYDSVTGEEINVFDRIGILDRKFRVINENVNDKEEWLEWTIKAYKSVYGYDWQGDSLLIARENLLFTFVDNYLYKFNKFPDKDILMELAEIISWNIWQMDGVKFVIPNSCINDSKVRYTLFGKEIIEESCNGCRKNKIKEHNGMYCKIMNWDTKRKIKFISLMKGGNKNYEK